MATLASPSAISASRWRRTAGRSAPAPRPPPPRPPGRAPSAAGPPPRGCGGRHRPDAQQWERCRDGGRQHGVGHRRHVAPAPARGTSSRLFTTPVFPAPPTGHAIRPGRRVAPSPWALLATLRPWCQRGELGRGARPVAVDPPPRDPSRVARRLGLTGSLLMGVGALGAGALPVPNPLFGQRLLGLPSRNATLAIAITYTGIVLMVLAWLWVGKMLRARGAVPPAPTRGPARPHRGAVGDPAGHGAADVLQGRLQLPRAERDPARGLDPYQLGPAEALGVDDPLTSGVPTMWRTPRPPTGRCSSCWARHHQADRQRRGARRDATGCWRSPASQ